MSCLEVRLFSHSLRVIDFFLSRLSFAVFSGQDLGVLHLLRLMQAREPAEARTTAALRDLLEDTGYVFKDLKEVCYTDQVIEAPRYVTKRDRKPHADLAEHTD